MSIIAPAKLAVAWLTMFVVGTELFVFSPLLPVLAADYHIAPALAGLSVTVFSLAYTVSAPLFGYFADRIGRRRVLIYSLLVFALANILTAAAANLPALFVARLLAGLAAAGISPSIYALVGGAAPPDRRATWLALVVSGLLVSLAVGASAGGLVGAFFGGSPIFLALAGLSLGLAWLNRWAWPDQPDRPSAGLPAEAPGEVSSAVLARRLIPMVVWSTGLYGVYTYLGAGLTAAGFSSRQIAIAIAVYGCGAIIGVLVGGRVADRLGVKWTANASLVGLCACLLLLRLAFDTGRLVEPALGLSSAVAQLFFPAQQAGLANDFPRQRATVLAWNNSALFLGISLGSFLGAGAVAAGSFDVNLMVSAGFAFSGLIVNAILIPVRLPFGQRRRGLR
ncbi:MAG: MFS transporter [Alphaproteobacteria bacterium]|nr:MFS transporter [Alphaproteobacteria bacterium]MBV9373502.1 MFS transporter [Alphaproteobacteria bacterium]